MTTHDWADGIIPDPAFAAPCSHSRCSCSDARSSYRLSATAVSSSSSTSLACLFCASQSGHIRGASQSPCIGGIWLDTATGAKTTSFGCWSVSAMPGACHSSGPCASLVVGTRSRSSQTMWPSQKSHIKAMSLSPNRSNVPTVLQTSVSSSCRRGSSSLESALRAGSNVRWTRYAPRHRCIDSCVVAKTRLAARHCVRCRRR